MPETSRPQNPGRGIDRRGGERDGGPLEELLRRAADSCREVAVLEPAGKRGGMGTQRQKREEQEEEEEEGEVIKRRKVAATTDVTMELDILDCPFCFHPLRPPIFQCTAGHAICSSCHDKLPDKCHLCSLATVYSRCYTVEHVVESIKIACSNASHGCTARVTYYQKEDHEMVCPHAPCFCPETGCGFSGPITTLLDHFSGTHKWRSSKVAYNKAFRIRIAKGSTVLVGEDGQLFLVNMTLEPHGGVISVCCIQPHMTGSKFKCKLVLSCPEMSYGQITEFQTRSTNLHDKLPEDCFPFLVPKLLFQGTGASARAMVGMTLTQQ